MLTINSLSAILEIIVFINSFNNRIILSNYLHNRPFGYMKNDRKKEQEHLFWYNSQIYKKNILKIFSNDDIKIQIYTDIIEIEINIRNMVQII